MLCIHGHAIEAGSDMCAQGHAGGAEQPPTAGATSIADLQNLLHQMMAIQNTSLQTQAPTAPRSSDRNKVKPDRPTIKQNSSDGDWQPNVQVSGHRRNS